MQLWKAKNSDGTVGAQSAVPQRRRREEPSSSEEHDVCTMIPPRETRPFSLIEKPLAQCYRDMHALLDAEKKSKGRVFVGTMRRYAPALLEAIEEIKDAIAVEADMEPGELEDGLEDDATMLAACAGLVVLDPESQTLRLVHYTAQEYLMEVVIQVRS